MTEEQEKTKHEQPQDQQHTLLSQDQDIRTTTVVSLSSPQNEGYIQPETTGLPCSMDFCTDPTVKPGPPSPEGVLAVDVIDMEQFPGMRFEHGNGDYIQPTDF